MAVSDFQYPALSPAEVVGILAQSQVATIAPTDLSHPTPEFIVPLYTDILLFLDAFQDDHGQVDFPALERLENPDHHIESVRIMTLCRKIKQLVAALHCPERFTLKDLLRPDSKRSMLFLSALLNFLIHKDTKMNLLRPIIEELTLLDDKRKEIEAKILELNGEIASFNEARDLERPLVQEVEAKVIELRQAIAGLNTEQMSLRTSLRKLKEKGQEMDEKISNAEFSLVQTVQENATLRSKIVQSPDKLQRALEEKKSLQAEAKNAERSAMQSFQEKTDRVEVYTKALHKMSKHSSQMLAIQEQVNSAKSIEKDVKALKTKLGDMGVDNKLLEAKLIELQGRADQLDESRKQLEKDKDLKFEEASKKLYNVKLEAGSRSSDLEAKQRVVEAVVAEVDDITSKINSVNESGAAKQEELLRKSVAIVEEFRKCSDSIEHLIATVESKPEDLFKAKGSMSEASYPIKELAPEDLYQEKELGPEDLHHKKDLASQDRRQEKELAAEGMCQAKEFVPEDLHRK